MRRIDTYYPRLSVAFVTIRGEFSIPIFIVRFRLRIMAELFGGFLSLRVRAGTAVPSLLPPQLLYIDSFGAVASANARPHKDHFIAGAPPGADSRHKFRPEPHNFSLVLAFANRPGFSYSVSF
jgi:hypothetical protein